MALMAICINAVWIGIMFAVIRSTRFAVVNGLVWKVSEVRMTNVVLEVFDCWKCRMCGGICMQGLYFFARSEINFF
jgi:hypothetical protein